MIVCEHVEVSHAAPYNCEMYYAEGWDGATGATQWCKEMRERFPDKMRHKVYAYEAVTF